MEETARSSREQGNPLGSQPIPRLLAKYALPSIVSMVVMSVYNIVDQIFIGWGVGYLGNSATTVAFPLITVMLALALLVGNGSAAAISLALGRGDRESAQDIVGNSVTMLLVVSFVLMAIALVFLDPILRLLGATGEVSPYARDYTRWIVLGAPFAMVGIGLSNIIRADGSPRYSMVATLVGALLNVALDPLFIFTFDMGVAGAAIATILSQGVSMVIALRYILRKARYARLERSRMRPKPALIRRISALGSSSCVTQLAISIFNVVMNNVVSHYGALSAYGSSIPLAAVGVVMKTNAIVIAVILGVSIGAQPILGFNYGAGNYRRVRRTYLTELSVTALVALAGNIVFVARPELVIAIFGDTSADFNEFAAHFMRTFLGAVTFAGFQIPSSNYFQAVGKPTVAMVLSMTRQLLFLLPLVVILPLFYGLNGVAYAGPIADTLAFCVTAAFILRELRHLGSSLPQAGDRPLAEGEV